MPVTHEHVEFADVLKVANPINAVLDTREGVGIWFSQSIDLAKVCTEPIRLVKLWYQYARRTPSTVASFNQVVLLNYILLLAVTLLVSQDLLYKDVA